IVGVVVVTLVTVVGIDVAEQPPLRTVTVYESGWVTVIDCVVAPFDHCQLVPLLAVRVTLPPGQSAVEPLAVIVAFGGSTTGTATCPHESQRAPPELADVT